MKVAVHDFISSYTICQQAKPGHSKLPGLLQPLSVPDRAWKVISLEFIEGLSVSGSINCILVAVDTFSKYVHFIGLKHPFIVASVGKLYLSHVYRLHGMPLAIVSDRDRIFTSKLWQELCKLAKAIFACLLLIIHNRMVRPSVLISVLRPFSSVIHIRVLNSGVAGWIWLSIGITPLSFGYWAFSI